MAAYEVLLLNTAIPQIQAAQSGDTYVVPRDIAFSTVANLANGTNLLPSLTFSSDTNTGIYREGADALGFTAGGGTNQMVLTSTGLGVGTNNPATKLDTAGTMRSTGNTTPSSGAGLELLYDSGNTRGIVQVYDRTGSAYRQLALDGSSILMRIAGTTQATLDTSGNLGLGVTPSAKLEIYSTNNAFNALQVRYNGSNDAMGFGIGNSNGFPYLGYNTKSQAFVDAPVYERSNPAAQLRMDNGSFKFNIAPSGTANTTTITNGVSYTIITSGNQTDFGAANNNVGTSFTATSSGTLSSGTVSQNISFTQAMTLDASGQLVVGGTNPDGQFTVDNLTAPYMSIRRANSTVLLMGSANSFVTSGSTADGAIRAANALVFAAGGATERARITSGGAFLVGTDDVGSNSGIGLKAVYSATEPYYACVGSSTANNKYSYLLYSTGAAAFRFYVGYDGTVSATNTTISGISDSRLKENIRDLDVGLNAILALKPRKFDWKAGKGKDKKDDRGFIAQEFEQVFPDLVDEWLDPAPEGEEPYKSVRQDLIPVLVKAIQEQQAMINELKAEMAALKGV